MWKSQWCECWKVTEHELIQQQLPVYMHLACSKSEEFWTAYILFTETVQLCSVL